MNSEIISLLGRRREGLSIQRIAKELHLSSGEKQVLKRRLKRLEGQGVILKIKKRYFIPLRSNLVEGKFITSCKGYGFVRPESEALDDIFIPARYSGGALLGDRVEVLFRHKGRRGKPEGRVIRIVQKEKKRMLGLYKERWRQSFFLPFDSPSSEEVPLTWEKPPFLLPGMVIEVKRENMQLTEILGMPDDEGVDTQVVIRRHNLACSFPEEVIAEANKISRKLSPQERKERKDYRKWTIVTIDGDEAQDFDDAVSVRRLKGGDFLLGIHIADVSHYVKPDSLLDAEAFKRGTSVYFPTLTLPMLPENLSNVICSLRPKEEKLAFSVLLTIDRKGKVTRSDFHPSLIITSERMTYNSVYKILCGDEEEKRKFVHLIPDLMMMKDLARILRSRRKREGSLDFDLVEPELIYKEGRLHSIVPSGRNEAHQIIEEFMLAANEAVATYLRKENIPLVFRIHPPPAPGDLERLREMLANFGLSNKLPKKIESKHLQHILEESEGRSEGKIVNFLVLKSLKLATYSEENKGHYGLAKKEYTHFTSPIRRYPDLVVHRILKKAITREKSEAYSLEIVSRHCSQQERIADEAEKELVEWRIFRFLKAKLGEEFNGIIVDITKTGLIVELEDYFVDGVVAFSDLKGDYYFKKTEKALIGKKTGKIFELGNRLNVTVVSVDPILRKMNLILS